MQLVSGTLSMKKKDKDSKVANLEPNSRRRVYKGIRQRALKEVEEKTVGNWTIFPEGLLACKNFHLQILSRNGRQ